MAVTGLSEAAQKNIVAALEDYKKCVTGAGYGVGGFTNYVKGDKSQAGAMKLFNEIVKDFQNEFALNINKIIKTVNTLNTVYSGVDSSTSVFSMNDGKKS